MSDGTETDVKETANLRDLARIWVRHFTVILMQEEDENDILDSHWTARQSAEFNVWCTNIGVNGEELLQPTEAPPQSKKDDDNSEDDESDDSFCYLSLSSSDDSEANLGIDPTPSRKTKQRRALQKHISDTIDRLNSHARQIERAGARHRRERFELYQEKDGPKEVYEGFKRLASWRANENFKSAPSTIKSRIAESVARRRIRFEYPKEPQRKRAVSLDYQTANLPRELQVNPLGPAVAIPEEQREKIEATKSKVSVHQGTILSATVNRKLDMKPEIKRPERVESVASVALRHPGFFPPLKVHRGSQHGMHDFEPYFCMLEECQVLFDFPTTFDGLMGHLQDHHPKRYHVAISDVEERDFNEVELEDYVKMNGEVSNEDLASLKRAKDFAFENFSEHETSEDENDRSSPAENKDFDSWSQILADSSLYDRSAVTDDYYFEDEQLRQFIESSITQELERDAPDLEGDPLRVDDHLQQGADPNVFDKKGVTSLYYASRKGHESVARLLIANGADMDISCRDSITPFWEAVYSAFKFSKRDSLARFFLKKSLSKNYESQDQQACLIRAVCDGEVEEVDCLLQRGADPDLRDRWNVTSLFWAAFYGHSAIVELLIDRNVDVNAANSDNRTPLFQASIRGLIDVAKLLIEKGVDPQLQHSWGETAILWVDRILDEDMLNVLTRTKYTVNALSGIRNEVKSRGARRRLHATITKMHTHEASLQNFLERIASIATRVTPYHSGIELRFINVTTTLAISQPTLDQISQIIRRNPFNGWTKIGTSLKEKVLKEQVYRRLEENNLKRPVMVHLITDGKPCGPPGSPERESSLKQVICECGKRLTEYGYNKDVVCFQISQIGSDPDATKFLNNLRNVLELEEILIVTPDRIDEKLGKLNEDEEALEKWLLELLMKPINRFKYAPMNASPGPAKNGAMSSD
ncbi:hypothetical protein N7493_001603 [Penicillium malachiteum]|uniref:Uncharacterized protein n=1 Tax=Penicillium malachiteum TaxID=1324776 RepID=A0AAD6HUW9_9EURO|nr:hypothetical protein N7493_001603 [Penicillium malachiteum]